LLEDLWARKGAKSMQMAKFIELEVVMNSQSEKITELETAYDDLKREKEGVASSYWRLFDKHKALTEKAEQ
jgi:hypothetical protein